MAASNGTCRNPACGADLPPSADPHGRGRRRLYCNHRCRNDRLRTLQQARDGTNRVCIDCGDPPLAGGLRCHPCFAANTSPYRQSATEATRLPLLDLPEWAERARCRDADPDAFFPDKGKSVQPALAICRRCPVTFECLQLALDRDETVGVWGGMPARERRSWSQRDRLREAC